MTGPLQAYKFNADYTWSSDSAVASFDGYANNFIFSAAGQNSTIRRYFAFIPLGGRFIADDVEYDDQIFTQDGATDGSLQARWHLQYAVPEPETYAMLLAGLGLVGFIARRKRATT